MCDKTVLEVSHLLQRWSTACHERSQFIVAEVDRQVARYADEFGAFLADSTHCRSELAAKEKQLQSDTSTLGQKITAVRQQCKQLRDDYSKQETILQEMARRSQQKLDAGKKRTMMQFTDQQHEVSKKTKHNLSLTLR